LIFAIVSSSKLQFYPIDIFQKKLYNGSMSTHDIIPFRITLAQFLLFSHESNDMPAQNKFPGHRHAQYELFFLLQGDVEMTMGERAIPLRENDLLIIPAGLYHRIHFKRVTPYRRIVMYVSEEHLRTLGVDGFAALLEQHAGQTINLTDTPFLQALPQFSRVAAIEIAPEAQRARDMVFRVVYERVDTTRFIGPVKLEHGRPIGLNAVLVPYRLDTDFVQPNFKVFERSIFSLFFFTVNNFAVGIFYLYHVTASLFHFVPRQFVVIVHLDVRGCRKFILFTCSN
jgi:mannose-6-phosphate isomerase-like protein (cupin superfamily)